MERESTHRSRRTSYDRAQPHQTRSAHRRHDDQRRTSHRTTRNEPLRPDRVRPRDRVHSGSSRAQFGALNEQLGWDSQPKSRTSQARTKYSGGTPASHSTRRAHRPQRRAHEHDEHYYHKRRVSGRPLLDPEKQAPDRYRRRSEHGRDLGNEYARGSRRKRTRRWLWISK